MKFNKVPGRPGSSLSIACTCAQEHPPSACWGPLLGLCCAELRRQKPVLHAHGAQRGRRLHCLWRCAGSLSGEQLKTTTSCCPCAVLLVRTYHTYHTGARLQISVICWAAAATVELLGQEDR